MNAICCGFTNTIMSVLNIAPFFTKMVTICLASYITLRTSSDPPSLILHPSYLRILLITASLLGRTYILAILRIELNPNFNQHPPRQLAWYFIGADG